MPIVRYLIATPTFFSRAGNGMSGSASLRRSCCYGGLTELQPMRSLHLVYIMLFVFAGGLLAQFVLRDRGWRWLLLFLPICAGMWITQRQLFPATPHIELPGAAPRNDWVEAFLWIRNHTPVAAYFALDPDHMEVAGEDQHGFRGIAERS